MEKMEIINKNSYIPYYLFEEITEYIEQTAQGRCRSSKWKNITSLLRLAVVNDRITKEQAEFLEKTYCREDIC